MQFRLKTLFLLTSLAAAYFALVFSAPLVVAAVLLSLAMAVSPAVWVAGVVYCRGGRQAFFLGGVLAGWIPFGVSFYYVATITTQIVISVAESGLFGDDYNVELRMSLALLWPLSGVVSFLGGAAAWAVRRYLAPAGNTQPNA